ncbi:MAG: tyrosine recombinase XerC [Gammaproteobacteria bacterium]|nr:tyrosine recombinase XerC [Gammaproteobacteria bacterium]
MHSSALEQVEQYLTELGGVRNYSTHTLAAYRRDLNRIIGLLPDSTRWVDLSSRDLSHLVATLHKQGLSPRTIQRQLSALRAFLRHLQRHGQIEANVAEGVKAPRAGHPLPKLLDVDEMARLLDRKPADATEVRDHAMFELFYSSGLRLTELSGARINNLDRHGAELQVTGKGNKSRRVPVGSAAMAAINRWLAERASWRGAAEPNLFISRRGQPISPRTIQARLKRWAALCGLNRSVNPHMLRHAFASHLLQSSQNLRAVQELLGHANISTTQIYTHLDHQYLARVYDQAHPRAHQKKP